MSSQSINNNNSGITVRDPTPSAITVRDPTPSAITVRDPTSSPTVQVPCSYDALNDDDQTMFLSPETLIQQVTVVANTHQQSTVYADIVTSIPPRWRADFLEQFSDHILATEDSIAFIATIHKNYLDTLTEADCTEMGLALPTSRDRFRYDRIAEIHVKSMALENRKRCHRKRLEDIWGTEWQTQLSDLLPKEPTEGLLWRLARLANRIGRITNWGPLKVQLQHIIGNRCQTPKASKSELLQSIDLMKLMSFFSNVNPVSSSNESALPASSITPLPEGTQDPVQPSDTINDGNSSPIPLDNEEANPSNNSPAGPEKLPANAPVLGKRKTLLSPPFSRPKKTNRQYIGNKRPPALAINQTANANRRVFLFDLTIESIHPVLVEEKIEQLKKDAEESQDARKQRNVELASDAVALVMGGNAKDDRPIAREEIVDRLQLIWDLLEISPDAQFNPESPSEADGEHSDPGHDDENNEHVDIEAQDKETSSIETDLNHAGHEGNNSH